MTLVLRLFSLSMFPKGVTVIGCNHYGRSEVEQQGWDTGAPIVKASGGGRKHDYQVHVFREKRDLAVTAALGLRVASSLAPMERFLAGRETAWWSWPCVNVGGHGDW